jgi:hypothetical protein
VISATAIEPGYSKRAYRNLVLAVAYGEAEKPGFFVQAEKSGV